MSDMRKQIEDIHENLTYIDKQMSEMRHEIRRLRKENKELKKDKDKLMKIAMKTHDSIAFPNIAHYVSFALMETLKDKSSSDEEKLENLKTYLKPSLDKDTHQTLHYVEEFKKEHESYNTILDDLISWIIYTYKLN